SLFVFVSSFFWNDNFITIIALFGLLLYTFFTPLSLRLKAKRQILLNQAYKNPFEYNFSKQGLTIAQGPNKAKYSWEDFYKIKETKKVLLFFISKKVAFILPLESCDNKSYEGIIELIKDFENKKLVNIKKVQGKI
ncbi:MAG: YcxB family protein, partial [Eubacteriales bacterium]